MKKAQAEVVSLIRQGLSLKEIAFKLNKSYDTVKAHRYQSGLFKHDAYVRRTRKFNVVSLTCAQCNKQFERLEQEQRWKPVQFCSRKCSNVRNGLAVRKKSQEKKGDTTCK